MHESSTLCDTTTQLPPHWQHVAQRYVEAYGNARCERWYEDLVYIENGLPKPIDYEGRVLKGFARKAARALAQTCVGCGRPAKPRPLGYGWTVQCAACHGKASLVQQINQLLKEAGEDEADPLDGKPAMWPEHGLPTLLSSCVPEICWRTTKLPGGQSMRYLVREDVLEMTPWFKRLKAVMLEG